jgi:uncharacterized membrane protein (UPF0182 family)
MGRKNMSKKLVIIGLGLVLLLVLWTGVSIYPDWLWFGNLGFSPVFWTMLLSKFGFGLLIWVLLMLILCANLYAARRFSPGEGPGEAYKGAEAYVSQFGLSGRTLNTLLIALVLIVSFVVASKGSQQWDLVLRYLYQEPFGITDPIFNKDIGFYVFSLPLYLFVRSGLMVLVVLAALVTVAWYLKNGALQIEGEFSQTEGGQPSVPKISVAPRVMKHLIFLGGIVVLFMAWGYQLKIYGLLYSTQGPAFGASYTDVHIKIWAYRLLILASLGFAFVLFYSAFKYRKKFMWMSGAVWVGAILVFATAVPMMVQKIVVQPNELAKESPYIAYNIDYTRKAYNLHKIEEIRYEVKDKLSLEEVKKQDATTRNIRIWDERPLLRTYRQIQAIRLYYDFNNVDVDRYLVNSQYRQVMLAARELVVNQLPRQANTWVNRHLVYTHGYGLASSPVNEVTREGMPLLFVKDLPASFEPGMQVERPEIYHGERTDEYVLIKTKTQEFDYPKGDENVYTFYQGSGGVPIRSFFRRLLFAIEFMDPQILFTTYLSPESRIMYNRRVHVRTKLIAPFLDYDADPYIVVSGGKLYWIQDAYTTSDMYPYSMRSYRQFGNKVVNYIRNSVKVTVDAYSGEVVFYVMDDKDPIVKTYSRIFPDLFRPFSEMPTGLKKHIRYPKDLFKVQAGAYTKYHMEDIQVFYNQEDLWQIPDETYEDRRQEMEPYYVIIKLPGEAKEEFLLMLPFTPSNKDNMIGWVAARSDMPNYGGMVVFKLPKEKLVYGPMQIEARVDQDTEISRDVSLWGQRGSRVIRGNLLAIPISGTFIYVEPLYLEAKQEESEMAPTGSTQRRGFTRSQRGGPAGSSQAKSVAAALPELKRVIVAFGNRLVMEENLDKALSGLFGGEVSLEPVVLPPVPKREGVSNLGALALEHWNRAKDQLRQGNWAEYGRELEALEKILKEMAREEGH